MENSICGGLPPELCSELNKEQQYIKIKLEKRKFGKDSAQLKRIASELKSKLAAGGTVKDGRIEIQGDHREKVKELLIKMGYPESNIVVLE